MNIVRKVFQWLLVLLMVALFIRGIMFIYGRSSTDVSLMRDDVIAVLDVSGIIYESESIINRFRELEKKDNVKGYILRVNSPGGLVTPSQEIYEYMLTIKKPLYVAMGSTAASGGYMVSLPANRIYAMPSTTTGSIGVIMQVPNYSGLMDKIGISTTVIKSGEFKDVGSGSRDMTPGEREVLMAVVMDMYDQFLQAVSSRRNLDYDTAKKLADGRIYTGRMAHELGLVDRMGSWHDAFVEMKQDLNMPDINYLEINDEPTGALKKLFSKASEYMEANRPNAGGAYYLMDF